MMATIYPFLRFLLLILLVGSFMRIDGQNNSIGSRINSIPKKNGLSELTNHFIYKDSKNFIWISSLEGLNRFDGRRVKVYKHDELDSCTLLDNNIQSPFFEDDNHDIWFTTLNAIHCYRRNRDNLDRFFIKHEGRILNTVEYTALFLEKNRWLWVRAGDSLFRYDTKYIQGKKGEQSQFLHQLRAARFDIDTFSSGQVKRMIACYWAYEKGVEIIDYDTFYQIKQRKRYFTTNNDLRQPELTIRKAIIENDTLIWLAGDDLVAFNPQRPFVNIFFTTLPKGVRVQNIGKLPKNQILVSTTDSRLLICDKRVAKPISVSLIPNTTGANSAKLHSVVGNIYTDKSDVLWLSTENNGVSFVPFNAVTFQPVLIKTGAQFSFQHIMEDKHGQIWMTYNDSRSGSYRFKANHDLFENNNLLPPYSKIIAIKTGQIWYVLYNSIVYSNLKNKTLNYKLDSITFYNAIPFEKSSLLLCSNKGLFEFDTQTKLFKQIKGGDFFAIDLLEDANGRIWVGTDSGNLLCYNLKDGVLSKPLEEIPNLGAINFFHPSPNDPSVLWVATAKGVLKIDLKTLNHTLITETNGLPTNFIQSLLEDKRGNLWCGINQGLIKYNPKTQTVLTYSKQQGLSSDTYNRGAALLSSTGEMWFGGTNGVDVFYPDSIKEQSGAPQSAIVGLKIYDKYWKGDVAIEEAQQINLKYFENTLTFELAAMEYTDPEQNRFKVMLEGEGQKAEWSDLGTQNFVTFVNLREGRYVFKLLTANSEGVWTETPKTLTIDIQPPYWRTWWFYALITGAICSFFYGVYRYRLNQVLKIERLRNRISADLHDDIGATLSNVNILTTLVRQRLPNDVDVLPLLSRIEEEITSSSESLDDIIWSVNPQNDSMERVLSRMRQFANEIFESKNIEGSIVFDPELTKLSLQMDRRRDFYLIFKEAINNLGKYAQCQNAWLNVTIVDSKIELSIKDDGIGFDPLSIKDGNGQKTMQQRADRLHGKLTVTTAINQGTTVALSLPIHVN
jgi:ligand-binding sensor domain-containing protein/two-component sensor histidine kinase